MANAGNGIAGGFISIAFFLSVVVLVAEFLAGSWIFGSQIHWLAFVIFIIGGIVLLILVIILAVVFIATRKKITKMKRY
jgi:hypothetical protein